MLHGSWDDKQQRGTLRSRVVVDGDLLDFEANQEEEDCHQRLVDPRTHSPIGVAQSPSHAADVLPAFARLSETMVARMRTSEPRPRSCSSDR
eukprot:3556037-Pleurochrysis_carterae.AAC.3